MNAKMNIRPEDISLDFIKRVRDYQCQFGCATDIPDSYVGFPAIYCLFRDDDLIYIGKTKNICRRLKQHLVKIDFDAYAIFPCDFGLLNVCEEWFIRFFRPPLNIRLNGDGQEGAMP